LTKFNEKRKVTIRKREVTFASKKLKSGETAYYRDGKRVESHYQKRLAKGVLAGKSVSQARGHPFGKYEDKRLTRGQIQEQEEFHLGAWAEPPSRGGRGKERARYYMKVWVTTESKRRVGSPTGDEDACTPVTLVLKNPDVNDQRGFTYSEIARNFERYALFTVKKSGMTLCTGELSQDLINLWRHTRQ
jgi:hypothetical protein